MSLTTRYDVVEFEGHHFITMEYVDGEDLATLLRRIGHRDLKPANMLGVGLGGRIIPPPAQPPAA